MSPFSLSLLRQKALHLVNKSGAVVDNAAQIVQRQQANDEGVQDRLLGEGDPYGLHTPQPESSGTARTPAASMPGERKLQAYIHVNLTQHISNIAVQYSVACSTMQQLLHALRTSSISVAGNT